jgi:hypothetical protein
MAQNLVESNYRYPTLTVLRIRMPLLDVQHRAATTSARELNHRATGYRNDTEQHEIAINATMPTFSVVERIYGDRMALADLRLDFGPTKSGVKVYTPRASATRPCRTNGIFGVGLMNGVHPRAIMGTAARATGMPRDRVRRV